MRILNVTETYAPFLEFGGPPVKVRALSEGLARRGHTVTVLTADWGLEKRLQAREGQTIGERSPFGWRRTENGVQAIYLPTWLRYRAIELESSGETLRPRAAAEFRRRSHIRNVRSAGASGGSGVQ